MGKMRTRPKVRDGLGSSIEPATKGASGGKGLPPRTHAIHLILYYAQTPLSRKEIEQELSERGYADDTVAVTIQHLNSLVNGSESYIRAVTLDAEGRYRLTEEARDLLSRHPRAW